MTSEYAQAVNITIKFVEICVCTPVEDFILATNIIHYADVCYSDPSSNHSCSRQTFFYNKLTISQMVST